jgi:integrase
MALALRVYHPDDDVRPAVPAPRIAPEPPSDKAAELTLRSAYELLHVAELSDAKPATRAEYRQALRKWEKLTRNPSLADLTRDDVAALRDGLLQLGYAPATIRKTWRHLSPILQTARREAIIDRVPRCKLPKVDLDEPRVASHGELSRLYDACSVVHFVGRHRVPKAVHHPSLFRTAIVLAVNNGLRFDDLWSLQWDAIDLQEARVCWLVEKTGRKISRPLNATVVRHLKAIRGTGTGDVLPVSRATVVRWWDRIRERAGVQLTWHDLRRTCQTWFDERLRGAGDFMLDHAARDVGSMYYRNLRRKVTRLAEKLRQPKAFRLGPHDPQKRLF